MTDEGLLAGRGAVVVGGSRGIGRAVSELLAACGAGVVVNGRDTDAAQDAASTIARAEGRAVAYGGSPADETVADALIETCVSGIALDAPPPEYAAPIYAYLASDMAADVTGQIFVTAGGFVGRFERPTQTLLGYRDYTESPPWSITELDLLVKKERSR